MPPARSKRARRLDPRGPLVFDIRALGPGSAHAERRSAPAPGSIGVEMVRVPEGAELDLDVRLEGVAEGVLATIAVTAPLAGECARCLEPFSASTTASFRELFAGQPGAAEADYSLSGDLLDLEPAVRDALVLDLPLSPLCDPDCPGLCADCGARLADAGPGHGHREPASRLGAALAEWSRLHNGSTPDGAPDPDQRKER